MRQRESDSLPSSYSGELVVRLETNILTFTRRYIELSLLFFSLSLMLMGYFVGLDIGVPNIINSFAVAIMVLIVCCLGRLIAHRLGVSVHAKLILMTVFALIEGSTLVSPLIWFDSISASSQLLMIMPLVAGLIFCIMATAGYQPLFLAFSFPIVAGLTFVMFFGQVGIPFRESEEVAHFYVSLGLGVGVYWLLQRLASNVYINIRDSLKASLRNKQTNQNLKAAVRSAKKANESKTRFLASASHDLRQPINSLALFVASLKIKTETQDQQDIVDAMADSIQSIDSQLESLLDISKLDAGIVEVNTRVIDLVVFVARIVAAYQTPSTLPCVQSSNAGETAKAEKGVKLEEGVKGFEAIEFNSVSFNDSFADVPIRYVSNMAVATVKTDPALLGRIIRNLISNAIKCTPTGRIRVGITQSVNNVVVSIEDTGVGISAEHLRKVFEEFYQVDNPQRDAKRGLGLGLSIVQRLCELLGHPLAIRSKVGVGTSVSITLPLSDAAPAQEANKRWAKRDAAVLNILVLDNERSTLAGMKSVLTRMGHGVKTVSDAEEAVIVFNQTRYDIALVDYRLPGAKTGIDVIKQFRQLDPRVSCFLVTGDSNIKDDLSSIEIIYKPVTSDKLRRIFESRTF
jgi:signal transduction histidine kinase